jgi:hypothetical protein
MWGRSIHVSKLLHAQEEWRCCRLPPEGKVFVPAERTKEQCTENEDWPAGLIEQVRSSSVNHAYNNWAVEAWYRVSRQSGGLESRMKGKSPKYDGQQDDCRWR